MKSLILSLVLLASGTAQADVQPEPILVVASVKVKPGTQDAFREAGLQILAPTRAEPGNEGYDLYESPQDPTVFTTVEHWRSQADIDRHMSLSHMQKFFTIAGPMFQSGYPVLTNFQNIEQK